MPPGEKVKTQNSGFVVTKTPPGEKPPQFIVASFDGAGWHEKWQFWQKIQEEVPFHFTGFLSGMMGVGGGTIMVPAMVLLLGMPQHTAQGTSLLAMVPASLVGAHTHLRLGNVDRDLALGLVPGVLVGTFLGGELAHVLPEGALRLVFAAVLVWTGWRYARPGR